jgi:hypothetical protein
MITTKEYRALVCRHSQIINTQAAGYTLIRDTFLNMAIAAKYRNHRYYRIQKRRVHLGQQERINFWHERHKSRDTIVTAAGSVDEYTYAMQMVADIEQLISTTNQKQYDYEASLLPSVKDPPCT